MDCNMPGLPALHYLPEFAQTHWVSDAIHHLILCLPLLLLPSILPSNRVFSNVSALHIKWPKYWSFSFSISPSNENSGLISFRIDRLDLLAVLWTFKSLLQNHSSKPWVLQHSAFFMVQHSHSYMTTGKITASTIWIFVGNMKSLFFNMLSRFVIAFLPKSKHLLISWRQPPSGNFGAQENKICHCFYFFPIYLPWSDGDCSEAALNLYISCCYWSNSVRLSWTLNWSFLEKWRDSMDGWAVDGAGRGWLRPSSTFFGIYLPAEIIYLGMFPKPPRS